MKTVEKATRREENGLRRRARGALGYSIEIIAAGWSPPPRELPENRGDGAFECRGSRGPRRVVRRRRPMESAWTEHAQDFAVVDVTPTGRGGAERKSRARRYGRSSPAESGGFCDLPLAGRRPPRRRAGCFRRRPLRSTGVAQRRSSATHAPKRTRGGQLPRWISGRHRRRAESMPGDAIHATF